MTAPTEIPVFTRVLAHGIHRRNEVRGESPKAFKTLFRHSQAANCALSMYYSALGAPRDELDSASEMVMWYGESIHEVWQEYLKEAFPGTLTEVRVRHHFDMFDGDEGLCSGHLDALVKWNDLVICIELKTKGSYGFNKAVGIDRMKRKMTKPMGPGAPAMIQGALNASAVGADILVIGVIGYEAVSRQLGDDLQLSPDARILAEWHYTREQYMVWAEDELNRMEAIASDVRDGTPSIPVAVADNFGKVKLNPNADNPDWRCIYCPYLTHCREESC